MLQACSTHYDKKCHVEYQHRQIVNVKIVSNTTIVTLSHIL